MVFFHHEEKQTRDRRVDVSALQAQPEYFGSMMYSIYDPFLVFEGKRLPPPRNGGREREYVTGGEAKCGGIQRFKLGLHGSKHEIAALIGYVQRDELATWFERINIWIKDLESTLAFEEKWSQGDELHDFLEDATEGKAHCSSVHTRVGSIVSNEIRLRHLWVRMHKH